MSGENPFATIEQAIEDIRSGRMVIVAEIADEALRRARAFRQ